MDANKIIDALGGTSETARLCDITAGAVSQWRASGKIPKAQLKYLQLLRPEVFTADLATSEDGPERADEPPVGLCDPRQSDRRTHPDRRQERHNHEEAA